MSAAQTAELNIKFELVKHRNPLFQSKVGKPSSEALPQCAVDASDGLKATF
jgi:hypothetical protein